MAATDKGMTLLPGEQCVLDTGDGSMIRQQVDVDKIISWKKGKFILEEQTLSKLCRSWPGGTISQFSIRVRGIEKQGFLKEVYPGMLNYGRY